MTDEQYIDIAIDISKKAKYPYGAFIISIFELAYFTNSSISVIISGQ